MRKNIFKVVMAILIIILFSFIIYNVRVNNKRSEKRYAEIRENVKKGVEWNIRVQHPGCTIGKEFKETTMGTSYNSAFLVKNGYLKKDELLDVDGKSYCDAYVDINEYYEDPLDHQHNCEVYYKIYLKCKGYKEKGYRA